MKPFALTALLLGAALATADEPRLYEQEPYDRLTLNDKERTTLRLVRVDLPNRTLPKNPDPKSLLRVRLLDRPNQPYDVAWGDVAELRLWEQLLLDDARRLVREHRFAEAFDAFLDLHREYPKLPGLDEAETEAIVAECEQALAEGRPEAAMARVLRLVQRNSLHPQLADLYGRATKLSVEHALKSNRPRAARLAVEQLTRQFPRHASAVALQAALAEASKKKLTEAQAAFDDGRYAAAAEAAQFAAQSAVDSGPALEVYRRAVETYPRLVVGVVETATRATSRPVPSWAQRRIAPLERRATLELTMTSGDSPRATYAGGANRWEADDRDPLRFHLRLGQAPYALTAADAAARLAAAALPGGSTSRADLIGLRPQLRVVDPRLLEIDFARPYPRPEALVAEVLSAAAVDGDGNRRRAPYPIAARADDAVVRTRFDSESKGPIEITERRCDDEEQAATALLAGEVDAVDRIAPWETAELRSRRELRLVRYAAPSTHLLLFNGANPRLQRGELRRAVGYALDRESILRNHLQPERGDPSARTIDGVFPIGRSADDPLGYAYDPTGSARSYDPARAFLLTKLSAGDAASNEPLVLAHPPTATAAKACRRIAAYLRQIGLAVELQPTPADDAPTSADVADLTYVVVSSTEPLVDAMRWFGPGGLVNLDSRALGAALSQAAQAESMTAARAALFELQRVLHDEALVVPLWQLPEHSAWRSRAVPPAGLAPTSLYQQVDRLQILPQFSEALP